MRKVEHKKVPNNLRKYRKALGLKKGDVAKILNLKSSGMIFRWEKGVFSPLA
jgi:transcriptional regulator with XRE-family HTH domain